MSDTSAPSRGEAMVAQVTQALEDGLAPQSLVVEDTSHLHADHAAAFPEGGSHLRVEVVAEAFEGISAVRRHRMVNAVLKPAFAAGLHAVTLKTQTPSEAARET